MNLSTKSIYRQLEENVDNYLKPKIDVGYGFIQDNTKSILKKRKIWKMAITSEIARDYWTAKLKINNYEHMATIFRS